MCVSYHWGVFSELTAIFSHALLDCEFSLLLRRCCYCLKILFENKTLLYVMSSGGDNGSLNGGEEAGPGLCSFGFRIKSNTHLCWPRSELLWQGYGGSCWLWMVGIWLCNKVEWLPKKLGWLTSPLSTVILLTQGVAVHVILLIHYWQGYPRFGRTLFRVNFS